jgi:hypothetical protein
MSVSHTLLACCLFVALLSAPSVGYVPGASGDGHGVVVNVHDFGATGDGVTEDGAAIERAVDHLNALPDAARPTLLFPPGSYIITGSSDFSEVGTTEGVKAITHANVTVLAWGAELRVPDTYRWERTTVGGDERDHFAQGLRAEGRNFTLYGGVLNGNLENREVLRGPTVAGYGGAEIGLRLQAPGARVFGTVSQGWGTDCCYVSDRAELFDCVFERGRRLGAAVVVRDLDIPAEAPIRFLNCSFVDNSQYAEDICNNPGAGIDIENEGGTAAVHLINCVFSGNRTYAIYISAGARDTLIEGCAIHGSINLQPSNLGGHRIIGNYFGPGSYLYAVYGNATDAPSAVIGNTFEDAPAVCFRDSEDHPNRWTIARNVFLGPEVKGVGRLLGEGHVVADNTFAGTVGDQQ